ncbi:TPA: hypothetical protein ACF39P_001495 [Enterococcus hirae]
MAAGLLMKAGNVSEELAVLNNEHSLNASLDTICGTMGSLGCGSFGCGSFGCGSLSSCC